MKAGRVVPARGLLATALIVSGLCLAQPALADVTVGVAVPRSGPYVAVGEQVLRGVEAAAREANAMGGLDGQPVVLDVQDDVCDSNSATAVANHFIRSNVRLVVGHVCSNASIAASDLYAANGIVMITAASVAAKLTDRGLPTIFRCAGATTIRPGSRQPCWPSVFAIARSPCCRTSPPPRGCSPPRRRTTSTGSA